MRPAVTAVATAFLLLAPTVLAFFSGGFYTEPRLVAAIAVWLLVLVAALAGPSPLPRRLEGRIALGGLAGVTAWSAVSLAWAPLAGPATESIERLVLYLGVLLLAASVLRGARTARAVEPALALGAVVVIGYGLAGRLLPEIVELSRSQSAGGRLEQPITYWNAEGALAAMGLTLCARLSGDRARPGWMRAAAAGAAVPLGTGVYLSYSRGAIAVAVLGLVCLVVLAPSRTQLGAAVLALAAGIAGAGWASAFPGVATLAGPLQDRAREGLITFAGLVVLASGAALLARRAPVRAGAADRLPWERRLGPLVAALVAAAALGLLAGGLAERPTAEELAAGAGAGRLATVSSNRYEYWRVGLLAVERNPLEGIGSGGFRVLWLQERRIPEAVRDVHALPLEMLAELGLVGLAAFAAFLGGLLLAGRRALAVDRQLAAGWCAAALVWLLHASVDWDWQLPAVTLPALVLAGALVALGEAERGLSLP